MRSKKLTKCLKHVNSSFTNWSSTHYVTTTKGRYKSKTLQWKLSLVSLPTSPRRHWEKWAILPAYHHATIIFFDLVSFTTVTLQQPSCLQHSIITQRHIPKTRCVESLEPLFELFMPLLSFDPFTCYNVSNLFT